MERPAKGETRPAKRETFTGFGHLLSLGGRYHHLLVEGVAIERPATPVGADAIAPVMPSRPKAHGQADNVRLTLSLLFGALRRLRRRTAPPSDAVPFAITLRRDLDPVRMEHADNCL
jgi:hypothetical protein